MKTPQDYTQPLSERASCAPARAPARRGLLLAGSLAAVAALAAVAVLLGLSVKRAPASPGAPAPAATPASEPVLLDFETLKGKWLRPDGGYVLELKQLLPQNALEAAYFNPNPIHVGKARLSKERGFVKVFVELQDVNYPGSTYTLLYDSANDQLRGVYYQATQQQEFEIVFTRMGKE